VLGASLLLVVSRSLLRQQLVLTPAPLLPCSWSKFSAGFTIGGLSGVAWAYVCTQILPYYQ
jgi:hypothetical protein